MRNVAILGGNGETFRRRGDCVEAVSMDGVRLLIGLVRTKDPDFRRSDPAFANHVLVRKIAFSLNFRERRGILLAALRGREGGYYPVGSDFAGEVVDVGASVETLEPGDRVIGNNNYPVARGQGLPQGLASIHASREYEIIHAKKLLKLPPGMREEVAAGFSVGAQTAYAMLRALQVDGNSRVLVTAARSNTSVFAVAALRKYGAEVYALARTNRFSEELRRLGAAELFAVDAAAGSFRENARLASILEEQGGFTHVIDPLCDLYCGPALDALAMEGKYVTCGFLNQYPDVAPAETAAKPLDIASLSHIVVKKLQIIGNCLGSTEDLQLAVRDFGAGVFPVVIDSVFCGDAVGAFFHRSYVDPDRFGKVIYRYTA